MTLEPEQTLLLPDTIKGVGFNVEHPIENLKDASQRFVLSRTTASKIPQSENMTVEKLAKVLVGSTDDAPGGMRVYDAGPPGGTVDAFMKLTVMLDDVQSNEKFPALKVNEGF